MRDFPSCFGENGVQVVDSSSGTPKGAQNMVTCVYQCDVRGRSLLITVTWSKNLMGPCLSVAIDESENQCICRVDIKPWLFSKRKGSKNLEVACDKIYIYWDLSHARFGAGPDPLEGFYLAVAVNRETALLLDHLKKEAKISTLPVNSNAVFVSKREHVFGKKLFGTKAQFYDKGRTHDLVIDCNTEDVRDPSLLIRIDSKTLMHIRRLKWKFRGNQMIVVDGLPVEVFWDVHNWLFGNATGSAMFMFRTCLSDEKLWAGGQSAFEPPAVSWTYSQNFRDHRMQQHLGFSLGLYAWKTE